MTSIRKAIAYCYPTSPNAVTLGKSGFHVCQWRKLESGEWSTPYLEQGHDVFNTVNDPDLLSLLDEADGTHHKSWCYTNRF